LRPRRTLVPILLALAVACSDGGAEYRLGMAGPLDEATGALNRRGAELALEEINAAKINGRTLSIDFKNDQGDGSRAAAIAQGFVDDPAISAVVGHITSGAMVAAAKVYDGNLAAVATTASSPALTGISRWTFRVISSDSANGADMARFAERLGKKRAAVLYENDAYGRGLADNFRRSFKGEVITFDPIDNGGANVDIHIAWFLANRPDIVFVASLDRTGLALLREARRQGLNVDFLGGDGWTGIVSDIEASEGALIGAPFTSLDPRPAAQKFVAAYRAKYASEPDGNAALAYDAVYLLAAALAEVGPDRAAIRDWLAARTPESPFAGATGSIAFLPTGDPVGKSFSMVRVSRGLMPMAERTR
jgi:branched-chain amino acid transport system substrate-binding protein